MCGGRWGGWEHTQAHYVTHLRTPTGVRMIRGSIILPPPAPSPPRLFPASKKDEDESVKAVAIPMLFRACQVHKYMFLFFWPFTNQVPHMQRRYGTSRIRKKGGAESGYNKENYESQHLSSPSSQHLLPTQNLCSLILSQVLRIFLFPQFFLLTTHLYCTPSHKH